MHFYKYQGTGNDFVMIDDRERRFNLNNSVLVKQLCDRRFGIGADGLILLRLCHEANFEMIYYNSDGKISSMCGNGGRCIARFAQHLKIIDTHCTFKAVDGLHSATLNDQEVALKMNDVTQIERTNDAYFLNTGSPHWIEYTKTIATMNVEEEGKKIRNNERFRSEGVNVNFIQAEKDIVKIRTYERGVEGETLSCGTGITAAAIAHAIHSKFTPGGHTIRLASDGGELMVKFDFDGAHSFTEIFLIGPAEKSFEGDVQ